MALMREIGATGPFLVIVPLSLLHSWSEQMAMFAPDLPRVIYYGSNEERIEMRKKFSPPTTDQLKQTVERDSKKNPKEHQHWSETESATRPAVKRKRSRPEASKDASQRVTRSSRDYPTHSAAPDHDESQHNSSLIGSDKNPLLGVENPAAKNLILCENSQGVGNVEQKSQVATSECLKPELSFIYAEEGPQNSQLEPEEATNRINIEPVVDLTGALDVAPCFGVACDLHESDRQIGIPASENNFNVKATPLESAGVTKTLPIVSDQLRALENIDLSNECQESKSLPLQPLPANNDLSLPSSDLKKLAQKSSGAPLLSSALSNAPNTSNKPTSQFIGPAIATSPPRKIVWRAGLLSIAFSNSHVEPKSDEKALEHLEEIANLVVSKKNFNPQTALRRVYQSSKDCETLYINAIRTLPTPKVPKSPSRPSILLPPQNPPVKKKKRARDPSLPPYTYLGDSLHLTNLDLVIDDVIAGVGEFHPSAACSVSYSESVADSALDGSFEQVTDERSIISSDQLISSGLGITSPNGTLVSWKNFKDAIGKTAEWLKNKEDPVHIKSEDCGELVLKENESKETVDIITSAVKENKVSPIARSKTPASERLNNFSDIQDAQTHPTCICEPRSPLSVYPLNELCAKESGKLLESVQDSSSQSSVPLEQEKLTREECPMTVIKHEQFSLPLDGDHVYVSPNDLICCTPTLKEIKADIHEDPLLFSERLQHSLDNHDAETPCSSNTEKTDHLLATVATQACPLIELNGKEFSEPANRGISNDSLLMVKATPYVANFRVAGAISDRLDGEQFEMKTPSIGPQRSETSDYETNHSPENHSESPFKEAANHQKGFLYDSSDLLLPLKSEPPHDGELPLEAIKLEKDARLLTKDPFYLSNEPEDTLTQNSDVQMLSTNTEEHINAVTKVPLISSGTGNDVNVLTKTTFSNKEFEVDDRRSNQTAQLSFNNFKPLSNNQVQQSGVLEEEFPSAFAHEPKGHPDDSPSVLDIFRSNTMSQTGALADNSKLDRSEGAVPSVEPVERDSEISANGNAPIDQAPLNPILPVVITTYEVAIRDCKFLNKINFAVSNIIMYYIS